MPKELYNLIGVSENASMAEIKKEFRKKALKSHPDKGGDPEEFKKLGAAYNILSDEAKREKYDRFGITDDNEMPHPFGHGGPGGMPDIFASMFGGRQRQQQNVKHIEYELDLEIFYTGKKIRLKIERQVINGEIRHCNVCAGRGMISREINNGFIRRRIESICPKCRGEGSKVDTKTCNDILEFTVEKGTKSGTSIVFKGKGNVSGKGKYGDLILILKEKKHPRFIRSHQNIIHKMSIGLVEALCGFEYELPYLDGSVMKMHYPGVIRPQTDEDSPCCLYLRGKGMPGLNGGRDGDLLLIFDVLFPTNIPTQVKEVLKNNLEKMLPQPKNFNKKTSYLLEEKKQRERDNERPSQSFPFHEANERMHHMDGEQVECAQS
tara:strand:+ start:273 stop:1406 length:1134 start_codon:yes stop_codon:yes gene_type:complete